MSEKNVQSPIVFGKEIEPSSVDDYRAKIAQAQRTGVVSNLKGSTPLGHVERPHIPLLQRQANVDANPLGLTPEGGVQPRPAGSPVLSPQTQAQLESMAQAQQETAQQEEKKEEEKKKEEEDLFDAFDFYGRSEQEKVLNNKKRRKAIEGRCEPMNFEDLLMKEEVRQRVPILPGKFEVVFRSLLPSESLFLKQFMMEDSKKSEAYYMEKYSLCQLCMGIVSINGKEIGTPHLTSDGDVNEAVFKDNLKKLVRKSSYIAADLMINYSWFDIRVRKLLNPDDLGNG
jgi:hypothetical protein